MIVLGIFAAIGVGLAICVALSDRPTPVSSATPRLAVKTVVELPSAADRTTQRSSSTAAHSVVNERCGDQSTSEADAHQATDASPRVQAPAGVAIIGPAPIAADAPCNEQRYLVARPAPLIEVHAHHDGPDWVASVPHPSSTVVSSPSLPPLPPDDDNGPSLPIVEAPSPAIEQEVTPPSNAQTKQQVRQSLDELRAMLEQGSIPPPPEPGDKGRAAPPPNPLEPQTTKSPAPATPPARSRPKIVKSGEGDDHLSLDFQDADIRDVLELISHEGGLNILPSNSVKGKVSASLHDVNLQTALSAILKSTGYVTRRQGNMIYVGTSKDFQDLEQAVDKIGTRIYQTNYVRAADLQALIQPLLTPNGIGTCTVTPASETGIAVDNNKAGGDTFAGGDSLLVRDYEAVLAQVDQVVAQIDKRPMQVAIEAMILSVKLDDTSAFGINFSALRDKLHLKLLSGTPSDALSSVVAGNGGMNFAFLDTSLGVFLEALGNRRRHERHRHAAFDLHQQASGPDSDRIAVGLHQQHGHRDEHGPEC